MMLIPDYVLSYLWGKNAKQYQNLSLSLSFYTAGKTQIKMSFTESFIKIQWTDYSILICVFLY